MRSRTLFLVLATALIVVFALLNWSEFTRATPLNFGWTTVTAPLGLILLGILALAAVAFLASSAVNHSRYIQHEREQAKALQAQRELADRAEASRFIDLRKTLEAHLRETREHDKTAAAEHEQSMVRTQRELRGLLEQMHRAMAMHLGEMEARLDARLDALSDLRADRQTDTQTDTRTTRPLGTPAETRIAQEPSGMRVNQAGEAVTVRNT